MASAIKSVEGAKVILAPSKGTGEDAMTIAIVELSGKATLGKLITAIEAAKTPHSTKVAPGVSGAVPLKLKPNTTPEQFVDALRKAGLLDET